MDGAPFPKPPSLVASLIHEFSSTSRDIMYAAAVRGKVRVPERCFHVFQKTIAREWKMRQFETAPARDRTSKAPACGLLRSLSTSKRRGELRTGKAPILGVAMVRGCHQKGLASGTAQERPLIPIVEWQRPKVGSRLVVACAVSSLTDRQPLAIVKFLILLADYRP